MRCLALLMALLAGCGTTASVQNAGDTRFLLISRSQAGGVWRFLSGETTACKLTEHGMEGTAYEVEFDGATCKVTAIK